jgi:serine protease Do
MKNNYTKIYKTSHKFRGYILLYCGIIASMIVGMVIGYYYLPQKIVMTSRGNSTQTIPQASQITTAASGDNSISRAAQTNLGSVVTIGASSKRLGIFSDGSQNIGSGFVVNSDGLVITNKHVISDEGLNYFVITPDAKTYPVQKIYSDPTNDIAVLKINATGLKPVVLGDSSTLELGQTVVAIGTPLGEFTNSVTSGIISGLNRSIVAGSIDQSSIEELNGVIQTDVSINPGNSGGPLLNLSGQVIGVNTAIDSQGQNISFSIPINVVSEYLATIKV